MPIYDVIIIGAGLSGLAAADQLAQNQRSFIMLEAREQPGGRVRTIFNEYCHPVELGAEFIHGRPPEIFDLIAEGRLRVIDGSESHMSVEAGRRKEVRGSDDFFAPEEQLLAAMHAHVEHRAGNCMQLLQDQLETAHYHNWHTDPYARGVYSYVAEGGMAAPKELAKPLEDTLFFAGEATDFEGHSATVHGAIRTGIRAAGEMLAALSLAEQR